MKIKNLISIVALGVVFTTTFLAGNALSEPIQKHARVAELEDSIRDNASTYLKARFPDYPFLVSVSIDPLRRASAKNSNQGEDLPYYDGSSDDIQDEWDNPGIPLKALISRTSKISVSVSLSSVLSDNEVTEVKESLMKTLHLLPARDEVQFNFRSWSTSNTRWVYPTVAMGIAILFLVGFFVIQRSGVSRIATALKEQKTASSSGGGSSMSGGMGPTAPAPSGGMGSGSTTVRGGVQVNDPIRARELMAKFVDLLAKNPSFPTLQGMILLEEYGEKNPSGLGALLTELPLPIQTKLYSLGSKECWFKALNAPGMVTMDEIELMQRLVREPATGRSAAVEDMTIKVWRLGAMIPDFLRTYPREVSMTILASLPKNIAISAARKAFPGAWAVLLDSSVRHPELQAEKVAEVSRNATEVRPLGELADFKKQKSESELIDYLKVASPEEEREIYLASKPDSLIHRSRPPFYSIFEEGEDLLKEFCPRITPDQWALALFNVERTARRKIQSHLGEKQSFLLMETIKLLDATNPEMTRVGESRETIARLFKKFMIGKQTEIDALLQGNESTEENTEDAGDDSENHAKAA